MVKDENAQKNIAACQTITRKNAEAAKMQARADVLAHLGELLNRADLSDLEFVCKGGDRVEACTILLEGRSPVLDSMLTDGILVSRSSVISLPEIRSPVLLAVSLPEICAPVLLAILEFLYTGNIVHYRPKDWKMGLEIISAAHFFHLPNVDQVVEDFSVEEVASVGGNLQKAATMLSEAMTFKCLSHDENATLLQLAGLLESSWMDLAYACHLSEEAVGFILRHTRPKSDTEDSVDISMEEYFRFRGVFLWCMCNSDFDPVEEVETLINEAIPIARKNLYDKGMKDLSSMEVTWLPNYTGYRVHGKISKFLRSHGKVESAIRLLAYIDWVRVPPTIVVKIVEPMKLVPESRLLDIFRFHSLHRTISMPPNLKWAHGESHAVRNGGLVIQKNGDSSGSAVCRLDNRASENSYVWRFILRNVNTNFCQVGFVCSERLEDLCQSWNFGESCRNAVKNSTSWALGVAQWHSNSGKIYFASGEKFAECTKLTEYNVNSVEKIEFQYYRNTGNCAVTVDGRQLGNVWTGLPTTSIFPAVTLGQNPSASVRLELVNGFEIF